MKGKNGNGVDPTIIVIFGATGDLAQRKLFPALFELFLKNRLPKKFKILAFARREFSDESYRAFVREAVIRKGPTDEAHLGAFLENVNYVRGTFDDDVSYRMLGEVISRIDEHFNICANKLFYLAVPPNHYENLLTRLSRSGLTVACGGHEGWTRILIEKPFGRDIHTAQRLDALLGKLFRETQVFRIDHYLAKEAVQNLLVFRFSNSLFEPVWNRKHIDRIEIRVFEKADKASVSTRAAFYDPLGELRDVGENHVLAMLSLITMEHPERLSAAEIHKARAKVLRSLAPITGASVKKIIRARYAGYRLEPGVAPDSNTETFFSFVTHVRNSRWKGVPIELSAGKALSETKTEIRVHFKDVNTGRGDYRSKRNTLTFRIQPNEGISICFWVKRPGFDNETYEQTLSFNYSDADETRTLPDAYQRVLLDAVRGDQMLFSSTAEMEAQWRFITPILEKWGSNPMREYEPGSTFESVVANHKNGKR